MMSWLPDSPKLKPIIVLPAFLLLTGFLFTACMKESDSSTDVTGNWVRKYEFEGVGRTEAVSFTIGNTFYIGGGYDGSSRLNDFWKFDQTTGSWIQIADFPGTARNSAVGFALDGKGYIGTGYDDNNNKLSDFWEYDPFTDTWTQKADFAGGARYNAVAFAIDDKGYIGTGYDGNYLKDFWAYDPAADTWTQVASLSGSKRSEAVAFVSNGLGYVVTGFNNGSYLTDFWAYDPASNTWTEKRKIASVSDESYDDDYSTNIQRSNASVFLIKGIAYLSCGKNSSVIGSTWAYSFLTDTWTEKTAFEGAAREGAIGFSVDDRGFLVSGTNSSYRFDDLWEFFPDEEQSDNDN